MNWSIKLGAAAICLCGLWAVAEGAGSKPASPSNSSGGASGNNSSGSSSPSSGTGGAGGGGGAGASGGSGAIATEPPVANQVSSWVNAQVMPKRDQLLLRTKPNIDDAADVIYQMAWPATVTETNGRWLHIKDDGGYAVPPQARVHGWVRADDVVRLEDSQTHYANHLELDPQDAADKVVNPDEARSAQVYYWLSGIYWESQAAPDVAITDYQKAEDIGDLRIDDAGTKARLSIDDVEIRLGRLYAASYFQDGKAQSRVPGDDQWEWHFKYAQVIEQKLWGPRPQLYLDWGVALSQSGKADAAEVTASVNPAGPNAAAPLPQPNPPPAEAVQPGAAQAAHTPADAATSGASIEVQARTDYASALGKFADAKRLAPAWWSVPLAHCAVSTRPVHDFRGWNQKIRPADGRARDGSVTTQAGPTVGRPAPGRSLGQRYRQAPRLVWEAHRPDHLRRHLPGPHWQRSKSSDRHR